MMLRLASYYLGPGDEVFVLGPEADLAVAKVLWGVAVVYICCAALRLARFNVESPPASAEGHLVFRGLPTPGAAGCVAALIMFHQHWLFTHGASAEDVPQLLARVVAFGLPAVTLLCALAMVSTIPYVHFTNRYIRGRRSFGYVAALVCVVFLTIWWPQEISALLFTAFTLSGPLGLLVRRRASKAPPAPAAG